MPKKPTYEELERRLCELETESEKLSRVNGDWEATFNALNTAVWVIDKEHRILRPNKMCRQMFHLTEDEMAGRHCWELMHGTQGPIPECPLLLARKSLKRETMKIRLNYKWYQVTVDPILDENGRFAKAVHSISDITERVLSHDRLQRGESLLKRTENLANMGGWEWDVGTRTMYWTEGLYHIHGLDPSLFIPGSTRHIDESLKCYRPKDRTLIIDAFDQCVEKGRGYDLEFPFTKLTGEKIWIRTAAKPVWESGQVSKVVGHIMDITDIKQAREEVRNQSERVRTFFDSISDAIFIHPLKEEGFAPFIDVNHIACERYGYSRDEMLVLTAPDITEAANATTHGKRQCRSELLEKGRLVFEAVHIKKSGEKFPVEINSNIVYQQGEPYILAVVRDITERKKAQETIVKEKAKLEKALSEIKILSGFLPICSSCKKIRDDKGYWNQIEAYIRDHSEAEFSHSICPECARKLYPDLDISDD